MFDKSNQNKHKGRDRSRSPLGRAGRNPRNGRNGGQYMSPPPFDHYPPDHAQFKQFPPFPSNPEMINAPYYPMNNRMMPPHMYPPPEFPANQMAPYVGPPRPMPGANELEIIVINRDQT